MRIEAYTSKYELGDREVEKYSPRRNIVILPVVECAAYIAFNNTYRFLQEHGEYISHNNRVDLSVKMLNHGYGCTHVGPERVLVEESMLLLLHNPVVSAGIVYELGCGAFDFQRDVEFLASLRPDAPFAYIRIHPRSYRSLKSIVTVCNLGREGCESFNIDYNELYQVYSEILGKTIKYVSNMSKKSINYETLLENSRIGVINGASNPSSIITNKYVGELMEKYIREYKGVVVEGQFSELVPSRIMKLTRGDKALEAKLREMFRRSLSFKQAPEQPEPTPGNIRGGIASLELKQVMTTLRVPFHEGIIDPTIRFDAVSLGEMISRGNILIKYIKENNFSEASKVFTELLRYDEFKRGLLLVESAGYDPMTGNILVMMGVNTIYFTTGLGSPWGGLVPTIKVTTDKHTWLRYGGDKGFIDYYIDLSSNREKILSDLERILINIYNDHRLKHEEIQTLQRYRLGSIVIGVETYNLTLQQIYMRA